MKRIILLSHCVLNSFCELPKAPDALRGEIINTLLEKDISIIQLPCPELSYQGLSRKSIYPGTPQAKEYEKYCENLLAYVLSNLKEYNDNNIEIAGIIGIDTSPSCSVKDDGAIMMRLLLSKLSELDIKVNLLEDMPLEGGQAFLSKLKAL